jgi:phosphoglucosamine mutase
VLSGVQLVDLVGRAQTPLSVLTDAVMERFPQVLRNVRLENRRDDVAEAIADDIAAVEQSLGNRGRVLIRLSGTEPLVRVMVEAPTMEQAEAAADNLVAAVISACSA